MDLVVEAVGLLELAAQLHRRLEQRDALLVSSK